MRGFARYLHAIDPAHEVPPPGLLAVPRRRPAPYIYHPGEIAEVLRATAAAAATAAGGHLSDAARAAGRDGHAPRGGDGVDPRRRRPRRGLVTIRHAKFDRMRLVPLHPSVTAALRGYAAARDRLCPHPAHRPVLRLRSPGGRCGAGEADQVFRVITGLTGLRTDTVHPRIHDLRHSFAVHTLIDWQREGADVSALLPVLSTYLGHVEPKQHLLVPVRGARADAAGRRPPRAARRQAES